MMLGVQMSGRADWPAATWLCYMGVVQQLRHDHIKCKVTGAYAARLVEYCPDVCLSSSGPGFAWCAEVIGEIATAASST